MKRLLIICTLALFSLLSCDSPMNTLNGDRQPPSTQGNPLSSISIPPGTPPAVADSARKAMWQQYKAEHGPEWNVRWNKITGLPVSIFSGLTKKAYSGNAKQAARAFMTEHSTLLGFSDLGQLQHIKTRTHRGIRHVTFQQTVRGVPVYEAEYKVHLRPDGRVDMANGTYYPDIEVSTSPSVSKVRAIQTAQADLNRSQKTELQTSAELVVYPGKEQFHLAWKLTLFSGQPAVDWFYIVDARSGEILYKLNQLADVTGDGDIYPTHPGLSAVTTSLCTDSAVIAGCRESMLIS